MKIAQKTLVGRDGKEGLNLIDLETKKLAIRIKTVEEIYGKTVGLWMERILKEICR